MKKLIYILVIGLVSSMAITSCTEEEVKPKQESGNTGGGGIDPK